MDNSLSSDEWSIILSFFTLSERVDVFSKISKELEAIALPPSEKRVFSLNDFNHRHFFGGSLARCLRSWRYAKSVQVFVAGRSYRSDKYNEKEEELMKDKKLMKKRISELVRSFSVLEDVRSLILSEFCYQLDFYRQFIVYNSIKRFPNLESIEGRLIEKQLPNLPNLKRIRSRVRNLGFLKTVLNQLEELYADVTPKGQLQSLKKYVETTNSNNLKFLRVRHGAYEVSLHEINYAMTDLVPGISLPLEELKLDMSHKLAFDFMNKLTSPNHTLKSLQLVCGGYDDFQKGKFPFAVKRNRASESIQNARERQRKKKAAKLKKQRYLAKKKREMEAYKERKKKRLEKSNLKKKQSPKKKKKTKTPTKKKGVKSTSSHEKKNLGGEEDEGEEVEEKIVKPQNAKLATSIEQRGCFESENRFLYLFDGISYLNEDVWGSLETINMSRFGLLYFTIPEKVERNINLNLTSLNLSFNCIGYLDLRQISVSFPNLQNLNISSNSIGQDDRPLTVHECIFEKLTRFDLSNCDLQLFGDIGESKNDDDDDNMIIDESFTGFKALTHLNLSTTRISRFPTSLIDMKSLEELDVSCNPRIRNTIPLLFFTQPHHQVNMRRIRLDRIGLTTFPGSLSSMKSLEEIDLSYNYLDDVRSFFTTPDQNPRLKKLFLNNNPWRAMPVCLMLQDMKRTSNPSMSMQIEKIRRWVENNMNHDLPQMILRPEDFRKRSRSKNAEKGEMRKFNAAQKKSQQFRSKGRMKVLYWRSASYPLFINNCFVPPKKKKKKNVPGRRIQRNISMFDLGGYNEFKMEDEMSVFLKEMCFRHFYRTKFQCDEEEEGEEDKKIISEVRYDANEHVGVMSGNKVFDTTNILIGDICKYNEPQQDEDEGEIEEPKKEAEEDLVEILISLVVKDGQYYYGSDDLLGLRIILDRNSGRMKNVKEVKIGHWKR